MARRVLGKSDHFTLLMRTNYAKALCEDGSAPLDDLREAVTTFEATQRIARRVLGSAHPVPAAIEHHLRYARAALARASLAT